MMQHHWRRRLRLEAEIFQLKGEKSFCLPVVVLPNKKIQ